MGAEETRIKPEPLLTSGGPDLHDGGSRPPAETQPALKQAAGGRRDGQSPESAGNLPDGHSSDGPYALSVVIPTYNEEQGIAEVVHGVHQVLSNAKDVRFEIIVVDDGSTDDTPARIPRDKAKVLRHPKNYGYGRALLTGIGKSEYPLIAIIDADNTYDPNDLARMIPSTRIFDMVIGAREFTRDTWMLSLLRKFLRALILFFTEHVSPDPNSGLRIFRKELVNQGRNIFSKKFSFSTSLTFFASLTNQFIEYVPIQYHDRRGISKVSHVRDSIRTLILIVSMALVFQPVKCFLLHLVVCLAGLLGLFYLQGFLGFHAWLAYSMMWLSTEFLIAFAFLAFIFIKANEQRHPFK